MTEYWIWFLLVKKHLGKCIIFFWSARIVLSKRLIFDSNCNPSTSLRLCASTYHSDPVFVLLSADRHQIFAMSTWVYISIVAANSYIYPSLMFPSLLLHANRHKIVMGFWVFPLRHISRKFYVVAFVPIYTRPWFFLIYVVCFL